MTRFQGCKSASVLCRQHHFGLSSDVADGDIYLYNKPGGQGTGGKGTRVCVFLCVCKEKPYRLQMLSSSLTLNL